MLGEEVLAVLTLGEGPAIFQSGKSACSAAAKTGLSGTALARQLRQAGEDAVGIT